MSGGFSSGSWCLFRSRTVADLAGTSRDAVSPCGDAPMWCSAVRTGELPFPKGTPLVRRVSLQLTMLAARETPNRLACRMAMHHPPTHDLKKEVSREDLAHVYEYRTALYTKKTKKTASRKAKCRVCQGEEPFALVGHRVHFQSFELQAHGHFHVRHNSPRRNRERTSFANLLHRQQDIQSLDTFTQR